MGCPFPLTWNSSWSSRLVKGTRTPTLPLSVVYTSDSLPPGISVAFCEEEEAAVNQLIQSIKPIRGLAGDASVHVVEGDNMNQRKSIPLKLLIETIR